MCSLHENERANAAACIARRNLETTYSPDRHADEYRGNTRGVGNGVMNTDPKKSARHAPVIVPLIGAFALLAGCASEPESRVVSAPPPPAPGAATAPGTVIVPATGGSQQVTTTTTTVPGTTTTSPTLIVQQAPPTAQAESPAERPSSRHVWVAGYWAWHNQRYTWVPGQWVVPPRDDVTWVPPRWERESNGYRFYDGYWD
jgi:hypothetical protein